MRPPPPVGRQAAKEATPSGAARRVKGTCLCGAVEIEIVYPAFWAWHDHSLASRKAHGTAYATYIGCWKKNIHVAKGKKNIATFEDKKTNTVRSFCARCGTPLFFERRHSAHMINIPRALFSGRTGREPRYHLNSEEMVDWIYTGKPLAPLKGYQGVMWERPRRRKRNEAQ